MEKTAPTSCRFYIDSNFEHCSAGLQTRFSPFMPNAQKSVFLAVLSSRKKGLSAKNFPSLTISLFQIKKKMLRFIDFFKYE